MKTVLLHITGVVQGVFYRAETKKKAEELGLCGWVKNLEDGSVQCCAQGEDQPVDRLMEWCTCGPDGARVDSVELTQADPDEVFHSFSIQ